MPGKQRTSLFRCFPSIHLPRYHRRVPKRHSRAKPVTLAQIQNSVAQYSASRRQGTAYVRYDPRLCPGSCPRVALAPNLLKEEETRSAPFSMPTMALPPQTLPSNPAISISFTASGSDYPGFNFHDVLREPSSSSWGSDPYLLSQKPFETVKADCEKISLDFGPWIKAVCQPLLTPSSY